MATSKEYLEFIRERLAGTEAAFRAMMGEYVIYFREKVVGGIYDDRLLVKPVAAAKKLMPDAERVVPYAGAKEMLAVDNVDDGDFLKTLFENMYEELPAKK